MGELVFVCERVLGLGVEGRTKVRVDEVGRMVEFHHCFWLPTLIGSNIFLQAVDDEVVVGMFLVGLNVSWVAGWRLWWHLCIDCLETTKAIEVLVNA